MFDLRIDNAQIFDGSGNASYIGSLAVSDGKIVAIGKDIGTGIGKQQIDGTGLSLMPGIIDSHTHYDAQITWDAYLAQSAQMGVTTALIGNCGFTIAPCLPKNRDLVMKNLTQVEGMSLASLQAGIDWDFESFPQYLDLIDKKGCALNLAAFVGHSTLRTHVMGSEASDRAASAAEIAHMAKLLDEALQAGAIGFATTTSTSHSAFDGRPMPSRLAQQNEMDAFLDVMKSKKMGSFMLTKGPASPTPQLMKWAEHCDRPFLIAALLHSSMQPQGVFDDLDTIALGAAKGLRVKGAVATTPLSFDFTFDTPYPLEPLQGWKPYFGSKGETLKAALRSNNLRDEIRAELSKPARRLFSGNWSLVHVLETKLPKNQKFEHQSIASMAQALGKDPLDAMFDLALEEDLATLFSIVSLNNDEEAVARLLCHEHSLISLSDAGAHLSFLDESGFGLHLLGYWCRDKKVMSTEQAVHRLTQAQALFFGIKNRGLLKEGFHADLLLLDLKAAGRAGKQRLNDLPAQATRVATKAIGVHGVWVNGQQVVNQAGPLNQAKPGKLLREFAPA
jgi:N-acyl-D-amino-acid deacylase